MYCQQWYCIALRSSITSLLNSLCSLWPFCFKVSNISFYFFSVGSYSCSCLFDSGTPGTLSQSIYKHSLKSPFERYPARVPPMFWAHLLLVFQFRKVSSLIYLGVWPCCAVKTNFQWKYQFLMFQIYQFPDLF